MARNYPKVEFDGLHIGQLIQKTIDSKGLEYSWVAKKLSITATGLYHRLKNPVYSDFYDIISMSKVLETDIIGLIYNQLHKSLPKIFNYEIYGTDHPENSSMQEKIDQLVAENKSLYELVSVLKQNSKSS